MAYTPKMLIPAAALMASLLQLWFLVQVTAAATSCPSSCGGVGVPYPFGIGEGCYLPGFNLTCNRTGGQERLLIGGRGATLEVVEISLANSTVRVMDTAGAVNITNHATAQGPLDPKGTWRGLGDGAHNGSFVVSATRNRLVVTGCNVQVMLRGKDTNFIVGCSTYCATTDLFVKATSPEAAACAGNGCCEAPIPIGRPSYVVRLMMLDSNQEMDSVVPIVVRVAETGWFERNSAALLNLSLADSSRRTPIPVVLEWAVKSAPLEVNVQQSGCPQDAATSVCRSSLSSCHNVSDNYRSGYVCRCQGGYQGNPYIDGGCQDVDECALPDMYPCSGVCTNTPGAYTCRCPRGSRGNPLIKDGCVKSSLGLGFSVGIGISSGAGLLLLVFGAIFVTRKVKHRRCRRLKHKFFRQNRGHLLQQLVSQKADIA